MSIPFFSNFFGEKLVKLSLVELDEKLSYEEEKRFKVFEKNAFSVFSQINYLLKQINSFVLLLSEKSVGSGGRVGKIVSSSKRDFVNKLNLLTSKLVPPTKHSFDVIKNYSVNSSELLEKELTKISKLISITAFGLSREMKELGDYLKELNQAFKNLEKNLVKSKLVELNELKLKVNELKQINSDLVKFKEKGGELVKEIGELDSLIEKQVIELNSLKSSGDAVKLVELNKELDFLDKQLVQLKFNTSSLIGKANKPLKKLLKLIESNRFVSNNYSFNDLNKWLFNSLEAIKFDQNGEKIKLAVNDCVKLINENSLEAKSEKQRTNWLNALNEISSINFFEEFFWKMNSIESKKNLVKEQLNSIELGKKIVEKQKSIDLLKQKLIELKVKEQNNLKQISELNQELINLNSLIQLDFSKIFGEKIELVY